jgi:hypothetical protein
VSDAPNTVWFQGVVEDRDDPLKLGRCRVRCVGFHTHSKEILPTADLPWAHPLSPITSASMNGIGDTPIGPVLGTWVCGFFRDGGLCQQPVMVGTLGGIPQDVSNPLIGFNDPEGVYPKAGFTGEADTNRLARNEKIEDTIVQTKRDDLDQMETAGGVGGGTVVEPETPYAAAYPYNKVRESESGHIIELDDTKGSERIHIYHKSGTFIEIHPDGSMVRKVRGDNHEVFIQDNNIHVKGNCNITVDGDSSILTKGESVIKCENTQIIEGETIEIKANSKVIISGGNGASRIILDASSVKADAPVILLNS